jgi:branched-chain amino acid transport system permease protein
MMCAFIGWLALQALLNSGVMLHPVIIVILMLLVAMGFGGILGMGIERLAYRPLRKATRLAPLISAIGVSIFLQNIVMLATQARAKVYQTEALIPRGVMVNIRSVTIPLTGMIVVTVAAVLTVLLDYVVRNTQTGRMMRATSEDPEVAEYMGISINRVISLTFIMGSALAGAAGVLIGLYYTQIDFFMGFSAGMKAFTAAVMGGIGNLRGAVLGGIVLGMAESLGAAFILPVYKDAIAFAILISVLIFRPSGILGENLPEKV